MMVIALALAAVQAKADLGASVMLRHNGQTKFYQWDQVKNAIADAVDGDTIYLTDGTFSGFNINKRIMIRGAGPGTIVSGSISIALPPEQKLDMPVLDAISFSGDVYVNDAGRQLTFRKVKMSNLVFPKNNGSDIVDMKLDRCFISSVFNLPKQVRSLNCFNCKITELRPGDHTNGNLTFTHCNIAAITDTIMAQFNSCVLLRASSQRGNSHYNCLKGCVLNNCIYREYITGSTTNFYYDSSDTLINCKSLSHYVLDTNNVINFSSTDYISSLDDTMIGCYGGQYPYNLNPDLPQVTKHAVKVDAANRKLNVTLTLDKK